jgi:hypothetical protein
MSMCQCWCGPSGWTNPVPFFDGFGFPAVEKPRLLEHPVGCRRAHGDLAAVVIEHHERQPTIAVERASVVVVDDRLSLPLLDPVVAGHLAVVLVGFAVALLPVVELALRDPQPSHEMLDRNLGETRPSRDKVDDRVAQIMGNPAVGQSSPSSFLSAMCDAASR